jgi:hypothetical protein
MSPAIETKLSKVRKHIMENIDEIPDLDQLAHQYELPRNTLKEGYKFLYGSSLHQFHADHKNGIRHAAISFRGNVSERNRFPYRLSKSESFHSLLSKRNLGTHQSSFLKQPPLPPKGDNLRLPPTP